jgi:hypothetical protein
MRTALACTLAAGVVIAGCGGSSAGVPLAAQDSATLRGDVSAIRAAAAASNPTGAHAAAAKLRADVQRLTQQGRLSPTDGQSMLAVSTQVDSRISAEVHAPTPATTTTPTVTSTSPAPRPAAPAHPKGPAKAGGHGHGPGHGGKHGGD